MKSVQLSCNVSRGRGSHHLALGRGLRVRSRGRGRGRGRRRGRVSWPRPGLREEHRDPAPALAAPRHPAAVLQRQAVPGPRTCSRISPSCQPLQLSAALHLGCWPTAPPSRRPRVTTPTAPRPPAPAWCRPARGRGWLGHLQQAPGLSRSRYLVRGHLHPRRLSTASSCCTRGWVLTSASRQSSLSASTW